MQAREAEDDEEDEYGHEFDQNNLIPEGYMDDEEFLQMMEQEAADGRLRGGVGFDEEG